MEMEEAPQRTLEQVVEHTISHCETAEQFADCITMIYAGNGSFHHTRAAIVAAINRTRRAALEECAKIAETMKSGPVYFVDGWPNAGAVIGGEHIAQAIRALK